MKNSNAPKLHDIVVSKVDGGHHLLKVSAMPDDRMSLLYRGDGWSLQYAVARGAKLAQQQGGDLWYASGNLTEVEYLETFRQARELAVVL